MRHKLPRQHALNDMREAGLNVSVFMYDCSRTDWRQFNGGDHTSKRAKQRKRCICREQIIVREFSITVNLSTLDIER